MTDLDELRAWLTWATTETHVPAAERAERAPGEMPVAEAAGHLCDYAGGGGEEPVQDIAWCLEHHPQAFRDLVLAWSVAADAMRAAVEDLVPANCPACHCRPCEGTHINCSLARYLAENQGSKIARAAEDWSRLMVKTAARISLQGELDPKPYLITVERFDALRSCPGCGCGEGHHPGCPADVRASLD